MAEIRSASPTTGSDPGGPDGLLAGDRRAQMGIAETTARVQIIATDPRSDWRSSFHHAVW